jgi:hypothetical protein
VKLSSRSNPQPGTFVNVGVRDADIVFVSRYRVKHTRSCWAVYVQRGDKWAVAKRLVTRKKALDAIAEHARSGQWTEEAIDPIGDLQRRVAALEDDLARLREQCGFSFDDAIGEPPQ